MPSLQSANPKAGRLRIFEDKTSVLASESEAIQLILVIKVQQVYRTLF